MAIAHGVIEYTDEDGETVRIEPGAEVSTDVPGYDELAEAGAVSDEPYDPEVAKPPPPEEIEIDGVIYVKASDGAANGEASNA